MEDGGKAQRKMGKRAVLIAAIGLTSLFCILLFWGHEEKGKAPDLKKEGEESPLLEAKGIYLTEWNDKGEKTWELRADSGTEFARSTILNKAKIFFFEEGVLASEGEADKILVNNQTSDLLLKGKVKLISHIDGAKLFTSNLRWISSEKKLRTGEKVLFKRGNLIMEGRGLIASPDLSQIVIEKEVTTRVIKN